MKYGLIGEKLSHSFSAEIHTNYFGYDYELKELPSTELGVFLKERRFDAVNVTIPYKEAVIPFLDEIDDMAQRIGAVNTIVNRNGKLYGYNTDYCGLYALIERSGIVLKDKKVLILGSGGTSKTALAVAESLDCALAVRVSRVAREGCVTYEQAKSEHKDAQVLINTTPCGMYPNSGMSPIEIETFPCLEGVVDVVYNPLRTQLVMDARNCGIPAVGGLHMLLVQAIAAAEKFTNQPIAQERMNTIYRSFASSKENIVLIGMPSCGKTTVGRLLAEKLERPFIDTDAQIIAETGFSIPELFDKVGEEGFRKIEAEVIRELAGRQGVVIATGGGSILHSENVARLKENGWICFLDRPLELLTVTADRPLSSTTVDLKERYKERYPIYSTVCDRSVSAEGSPEEVANLIREDFLYENFDHQRS